MVEKKQSHAAQSHPAMGTFYTCDENVKRFWQVYCDYWNSVAEACDGPDARKRFVDAQERFFQGLREGWTGRDDQKYQNAYSAYWKELPQVVDNVRQNWTEAYRIYVRGLQDAWSNIAVDSLDPTHLALIARIITAGACLASHTVQRQRA